MRNKSETSNLGPIKIRKLRKGRPQVVVPPGHGVPPASPSPSSPPSCAEPTVHLPTEWSYGLNTHLALRGGESVLLNRSWKLL